MAGSNKRAGKGPNKAANNKKKKNPNKIVAVTANLIKDQLGILRQDLRKIELREPKNAKRKRDEGRGLTTEEETELKQKQDAKRKALIKKQKEHNREYQESVANNDKRYQMLNVKETKQQRKERRKQERLMKKRNRMIHAEEFRAKKAGKAAPNQKVIQKIIEATTVKSKQPPDQQKRQQKATANTNTKNKKQQQPQQQHDEDLSDEDIAMEDAEDAEHDEEEEFDDEDEEIPSDEEVPSDDDDDNNNNAAKRKSGPLSHLPTMEEIDDEIRELEKKLGIKEGGQLPSGDFDDSDPEDEHYVGGMTGYYDYDDDDDDGDTGTDSLAKYVQEKRNAKKNAAQQEPQQKKPRIDPYGRTELDAPAPNEEEDAAENKKAETAKQEKNNKKQDKKPASASASAASKTDDDVVKKYVPPHLRAGNTQQKRSENYLRLQRLARGIINKLSDANLERNLSDIIALYADNSKNDMNEIISDLILNSVCDGGQLLSNFILVYATFVTGLNCSVGMEAGSFIVEKLCKKLDGFIKAKQSAQANNAVVFICHLYNLQMLHCTLIYDLIRTLSQEFTELNLELLLKLIKTCGFQLRSDDPESLRDIIVLIQGKVKEYQAQHEASRSSSSSTSNKPTNNNDKDDGNSNNANDANDANANEGQGHLSKRVMFMMDMLTDIKNNKRRQGMSEEQDKYTKIKNSLEAVLKKAGKDVIEAYQLRMTYTELLSTDKKGRWWLVGTAWVGNRDGESVVSKNNALKNNSNQGHSQEMQQLEKLARAQRMNTDLRRSIFYIIMSSEDYLDAFQKLVKLGFKNKQDREIIRVLLDCAAQEKTYNPFYSHLALRICSHDRHLQYTMQMAFWDHFKQLSEYPLRKIVNLSKVLAMLLGHSALSLSALKIVEFERLAGEALVFFRLVFMSLLLDFEEKNVGLAFFRIATQPEFDVLRKGIEMFLYQFIKKQYRSTFVQEMLALRKSSMAAVNAQGVLSASSDDFAAQEDLLKQRAKLAKKALSLDSAAAAKRASQQDDFGF